MTLELRDALARVDRVRLHVGERRPVLAHELAQAGASLLHVGEPLRVGDDLLGRDAHIVADFRRLDLERAQPFGERRERLARRDRRDRGAERVLRGALEARVRVLERRAMRLGVGEDLLLRRERRFLVGVFDLGRVDLRELVAQEVELPRARAVVAADLGLLLFDCDAAPRARPTRSARAAAAGSPA